MVRAMGGRLARGVALGALALALPAPLLAQTFSLPPGTPTPSPRPAGPVDTDAPIVAPRPTPRPSAPAPAPTPSASPAPVLTVPTPRPVATGARPAPARVQPGAVPQATASAPAATFPGDAPSASPGFTPVALPSYAPARPAAVSAEPGFFASNWPWLLGLLAALGAGAGGALWLRQRREERDPVIDFEPPVVVAPAAPALAEPAPEPNAAPPAPAPALVDDGPLSMVLEATKLSATLLNTSLAYRLSITNHGDRPLGPLTVAAGMAAAHASQPVERQLALNGQLLMPKHTVAALAPGESATLSGEIRLPLALIQPIRAGEAALFIPLARFAVDGPDISLARTFVVGEAPEVANAALRPFRLDLGPRVYSRIGQREIVAAAA